jgi:hypothetical protein
VHPLSRSMAVAIAKRYPMDERHRIDLEDLVRGESMNVIRETGFDKFPVDRPGVTRDEVRARIRRYDSLTESLLGIFIVGCQWGSPPHLKMWSKWITAVADRREMVAGSFWDLWESLRWYPALLLGYGGGIVSFSSRNYEALGALFLRGVSVLRYGEPERPLGYVLAAERIIQRKKGGALLFDDGDYAPGSRWLFERLRVPLVEVFPRETDYKQAFAEFEAFMTLLYADWNEKVLGVFWAPLTKFGERFRYDLLAPVSPMKLILDDAEKDGVEWGAFKVGFFDGSIDRLRAVIAGLDDIRDRWEQEMYF